MYLPSAYCRSLVLTGFMLLVGGASAPAALADASTAEPRTLHVASDGLDSRDCLTPATACKTFDRGYHAAAPGDVVEVAGGTYPFQWFSADASKVSEADVVVRPAAGARVVVGCPGPNNCLATDGADHLTVEGMAMAYLEPIAGLPRQGGVALDRGSRDVTFRDIDAGHVWLAADDASVLGGDYGPTVDEDTKIAGGDGANQLIDGAFFHDNLNHAQHMQCIWLAGATGVTIRNSRFDTCSTFAIFSTPEVGQHYRDVLIENNVFSNSGDVSMSTHVKVGSHGGDCTNFLIRNNTFVDENVMSDCGIESVAGSRDRGTATNIRWIGNIFTHWETGGECDFGGHVFDYNVIETGNKCGEHDLAVGPGNAGFVDRAGLDFRLRPDSPAIDRGSPTNFPAHDFDGNPRPRGVAPDAGAFEGMPPAPDDTPPTIRLGAPVEGAAYPRGAIAFADFDCVDDSGSVTCIGTVDDGAAIDTATLGRHEFTVTATDAAGNTTPRTITYTVVDRTAPTISLSSPLEGAAHERGPPVLADYACDDDTGVVESCTGTVADGEAIDTTVGTHTFTVTATDTAGNTATRTVTYTVVDRTKPTIDLRTPIAGASYTRGTTVLADFDCADETALGSCVGTAADGQAIDTTTLGARELTVTATDLAGNTTTRTVAYTVADRTKPTIDPRTPTPDGRYELGDTAVVVDFDCADEAGGSGLASCDGTLADGSTLDTTALGPHELTITAKDRAGNTTTLTVRYAIVGDATAPAVELRSPPLEGATYDRGEVVVADFSCADDPGGSGLADVDGCRGTAPNGQPIDTSTLGGRTFTVTAEDKAGNTAIETVTYMVADRTKPTIELRRPAAGATYERGETVSPDYECDDDTEIESCVATAIDTATLGERDFTVTATDTADNTTTRTVSYTVLDVSDPSIELRAPRHGATYVRGAAVAAAFSCADDDGGSGVAWCRGPVATGARLDTSTLGVHRFTVSAGDKQGNRASREVRYTVVAQNPGGHVPPEGEPLPRRRYGPGSWNRSPGSPRATLSFRLPTRAELLGTDGLAVSIDCRRRCRAAVAITVRAGAERVRVRVERRRLSSHARTLRLPLSDAQRERLLDIGPLRVRLTASARDARGRRAKLAVAAFEAAG